jgi:hypothetical protein
MAAGDIGPVGDAAAHAAQPRARQTIFGKIGLVFAIVPWLIMGTVAVWQPG